MKKSFARAGGIILLALVAACSSADRSKSSAPAGAGGVAPVNAPLDAGADTSGGTTPGVGPMIVRNADLTIEVEKGDFKTAFDRASMVADTYSGYVLSSSTAGDESKSGDLNLRIPSASFDDAMHDLRALGAVQLESVKGEEVTNQFIDLNARLKSWEAQERVLLKLMSQATSINETMDVQRQLQQVQVQIEQIKGQLRVLNDQTALATIAVTIHEPGVTPLSPGEVRPNLGNALSRFVAGFVQVIYAAIIALGYLIPISVIFLLLVLIGRRVANRFDLRAPLFSGPKPPPPSAPLLPPFPPAEDPPA